MIKRYVREEDGNIYDRKRRRIIEVRREELIGRMLYINYGSEDGIVISVDEIDDEK